MHSPGLSSGLEGKAELGRCRNQRVAHKPALLGDMRLVAFEDTFASPVFFHSRRKSDLISISFKHLSLHGDARGWQQRTGGAESDNVNLHNVGPCEVFSCTAEVNLNTPNATQMNNAVPTSPLLPQLTHPHSYPSMGQITNPYEQQQPGKELNKYASLKAVADKGNEDFYSKRRHLTDLATKGNLPLHPVRVEDNRPYILEGGTMKQNGQKSKGTKPHMHPLAYKTWDPSDQSLRRQAYATKGRNLVRDPSMNDPLTTQSQHYLPTQPYFITNSQTEVTV
ncbi:hypothetical protein JRQ81_010153 [Phrynocephalus forsythii]|uniref:Protein shisa-9 n=1 Tax=Phrynocephalus forsythii TaxID=171643 RepID=A0A9Q1ARA3_9SAUR|nr:hypothetical protein JRQ81_010153 [Phrynocephalus forsythii]